SEQVILKLVPTTSYVLVGQFFPVEIEVLAGAQNVDAVSAYLDFDPTVLQVVDESGNPTTQVIPGSVLTNVTTNNVTAGHINFVANGGPADGRFTVAPVHFKAITTATNSLLVWSTTAPRQSNVASGGISVLGSLQGGSIMAEPGAFLTGQATMQGRPTPPHSSWSVPLLLTLSRPGEWGAAYVYGISTTASGGFTMPAIVSPGSYMVHLKGMHTLRNLLRKSLSSGANAANLETLLEGDAVNDNHVDSRDLSLLTAAYGKSQGQAGFDPRANFNEDNAINDADVSLLEANLGRRGDILVGAAAAGLAELLEVLLSPEALVAGTVALRVMPTNTVASVGGTVVLDIVADAGAQMVDTAELHLDFDPTVLQVVDSSSAVTTVIEAGTDLPRVFQSRVDTALGWIDFLASCLGSTVPSGRFTVARVRFTVLQAKDTWVRFSFSGWRTTDLDYHGASVLGNVEAAHVQPIAQRVLYLPVVMKRH
ncbi:MAG: cohesin domain-containing protein, partial [Candidatus Hadarchaeum sp.]